MTTALGHAAAVAAEYEAVARSLRPRDIEEAALRNRSSAYRELLAHLASYGTLRLADFTRSLDLERLDLDPPWVAALGRVIGLAEYNEGRDVPELSFELLAWAVRRLPAARRHAYVRLLVELEVVRGGYHAAEAWLDFDPPTDAMGDGYLRTDLRNPFGRSPLRDERLWRDGFARRFISRGLAAPEILAGGSVPFDGLSASASPARSSELISVVMTTYEPDPERLTTSVRSILAQTWSDLELIIVDDCSPSGHEAIDAVARTDERVRVITLETNGGTYLARNVGIAAARGRFVTGQDDDDWSHPSRLELQVAPLLADNPPPATLSKCLTVSEHMVMLRPGFDPLRPNASSLMFVTDTGRHLGGFVRARRAADSEFHRRLEVHAGRPALVLEEPLSLVRIRSASLSRSDFRPGWHHPARRAFRSAFRRWHEVTPRSKLVVDPAVPPFPVPERFAVERSPLSPLDVVFTGDWRMEGPTQRAAYEEAAALVAAGMRVGLLQVEGARHPSRRNEPLAGPFQDLINAGVLTQALDDEPREAGLVIVRDPSVFQFPPDEPYALNAHAVLAILDEPPASVDSTRQCYEPATVDRAIGRTLGEATWAVAHGVDLDEVLSELPPTRIIADRRMPWAADTRRWATERASFRSDRPVVGFQSLPQDQALDVENLSEVVDLRCLLPSHLESLGVQPALSTGVLAFEPSDIDRRVFLSSVDFFVHYPTPYGSLSRRNVVEALAAGVVAILPPQYRAVFGDAAVYASPGNLAPTALRLWRDLGAYVRQSERARAWAESSASPQAYVAFVESLPALRLARR